jgi:Leucine-rich repeat (LRR) protein
MSVELTEHYLKRVSGNFDLTSIFTLSLHGVGLCQLRPILSACTSLTDLDLSNNSISNLQGLDGRRLQKLEILNVSHNLFSDVASFTFIPTLRELYLQGNQINSIEQISLISAKLPGLRVLYLQNVDNTSCNPLCNSPTYRSELLALMPGLEILDGKMVRSVAEREFSLALNESNTTLNGQLASLERAHQEKVAEIRVFMEKIKQKGEFREATQMFNSEIIKLQEKQKESDQQESVKGSVESLGKLQHEWLKLEGEINQELINMKNLFDIKQEEWEEIQKIQTENEIEQGNEVDERGENPVGNPSESDENDYPSTNSHSPSLVSREIQTGKLNKLHKKIKQKK